MGGNRKWESVYQLQVRFERHDTLTASDTASTSGYPSVFLRASDQAHADRFAELLGAMCIDHIDLLVMAVDAGLTKEDLVAGGIPAVPAHLIIQGARTKAKELPAVHRPRRATDIHLRGKYWLERPLAAGGGGGKVLVANGYCNGPQIKPYKLKLSTDPHLLSQEKAVLDAIARWAL